MQPGGSTRGKLNWRISPCGYGMTLAPCHQVHLLCVALFAHLRCAHRLGSLVLLGLILSNVVAPGWIVLTWFVGASLVFAGVGGFCGMARPLAVMPWNRVSL
jgi:hypothetical protein